MKTSGKFVMLFQLTGYVLAKLFCMAQRVAPSAGVWSLMVFKKWIPRSISRIAATGDTGRHLQRAGGAEMAANDTLTLGLEFEEIIFGYEDRYSWALSRISELEERLEKAKEIISQMVEGNSTEWDT